MSKKSSLTVSKESIALILTLIYIYILSSSVGPQYIYGDQLHYRDFYDSLYGTSLEEGFRIYKYALGTQEPIYYYLAWISSNLGFEKDNVITIANLLLAFFSFKALSKLGSHPFLSLTLICFNYYFIVFYFAAERLKFGILFLAIFVVINRYKVVFVILASMSHIQSLMLLLPISFTKLKSPVYNFIYKLKLKKSILPVIFISLVGLLTIFIVLQEHIVSKINFYQGSFEAAELIKTFVFFSLSLIYAKSKQDAILAFIPIFIFSGLFGGDRVNFIAYLIFLYFALPYRRGFNFGVLLTHAYYCYTGYFFIQKIVKYGSGFAI